MAKGNGKKVTIKISPNGDLTVDADGFTGQSCKDATKVFVDAFERGSRSKDDQNKPEFYESETEQETVENQRF